MIEDNGFDVPVPPPGKLQYLLEAFFQIGPDSETGGPILWSEIYAYSELTGMDFTPWESSLLYRMSREYVEERMEAVSPFSIEPLERDADG